MKPTNKEIENWAKTRGQGMWHFVLLKGALAWGLLTASSVLTVSFVTSGFPGWWLVLMAYLFSSVAGAVLCYWIWQRMEEAYLQTEMKS
jgi:hypothetical protein